MITKKLLLAALAATSIIFPAALPAQSFSIEIGDRPYYRHGATYWAGDYEMIWVPGHREGRHWVHGRYIRSERRNHNWDRRHDRHDRWEDRSDDRRDDRSDYRRDDRY